VLIAPIFVAKPGRRCRPGSGPVTYPFDIPGQPLATGLPAFEAITGASVTRDPGIEGISASAVSGVYSAEQGLDLLLAGTGLTARLVSARQFAIGVRVSSESVEVTGRSTPYVLSGSTTATRTLTPLRDIPQTLAVVPKALLNDQAAQLIAAAVKNVPGVPSRRVKAIATRSSCVASARHPTSSSTVCATIRNVSGIYTTLTASKSCKALLPSSSFEAAPAAWSMS